MITQLLIGLALHVSQPKPLDINKLAYAVSMQETHGCTIKNSSARYFNCYGIQGRGGYVHFKTKEESTEAFTKIWRTHYKIFPTLKLAAKWSSPEAAPNWLKNVTYYYNHAKP